MEAKDGLDIVKDGATNKLIIKDSKEEDSGTYKFEADGRKSEATLRIQGTNRFICSFFIYQRNSVYIGNTIGVIFTNNNNIIDIPLNVSDVIKGCSHR